MVRCNTCNVLHMQQFFGLFPLFSMIWYRWIQSPAMFKRQDVWWYSFCWSISLSIDYVWNWRIDRVITTSSCSYCIWNRYCQNNRRSLPILLLFTWFDMVELNHLPCQNNKMHDDIVFADRLQYQLTMFDVYVLIGLSRLLDSHIAYAIVIKNLHWQQPWWGKRSL